VTVAGIEQDESLKYTYDNANQLTSIGYPDGFSISYSRNNAGQITGVNLTIGTQPPMVLASNIHYLPFGPLKNLTWGNGIQLNRQYNQDYQLTTQTIGTWQSTLSYDANGNIKTRNHSLFGNQNYSYDALGHLTEEKSTTLRKTYSYDPTGNRKQRNTYDTVNGIEQRTAIQTLTTAADSNRMLQNDSWTMTLSDAAGNTLQQSQNLVYAYNSQGRLSEVRNPTNLYANYSYNTLGQRTLKRIFSANNAVTPTATYSYLYGADGQLFGQKTYSSTGKPSKAQYWVWLDGQPIAGIELEYTGKGTVNKTSQYYLHSDHLNTPRMATNQSQTLLWSWNSDAFGTGGVNGNTHGNKASLDMPLRFPGQLYDAHTAMNYNYFRDYDPNTGRYIQSDPIGLKGGINTYSYVGGNPISKIDPLGLDAIIAHGGTLTYYNNNGAIVSTYSYTTGRPGVTDTTISGQGPIPLGTYAADPQQISQGGFFRNLLGDWGNFRVPLKADRDTETFGRNGFFLHGGKKPGSAGCIDVGGSDKDLFKHLQNAPGLVPIVVY
jgi:RHS repeat-associated protein